MPGPPTTRHDDGPRRLEPGAVVERYVVDALIGDGGTASVYRVHHAELGTAYALKVLNLHSPGIRRRTLQEGRIQARLSHRNIVAVYDTFEVDGAPGLLLELIDGPSLETALPRIKLNLEHAEILFRGVLEGVRQAHNFGLVHRDLKPANVLLARTPSGLIPKVTDFGIAKLGESQESGHTRAGVAMGTPQYMAPEQIRDARSVDRRADIFSLGCILYELVTGRRTFPDDDIVKVYNAVCDGQWVPATQLVPDLPARIDETIRGCLATVRDRRIPDCATLLEVLDGTRPWTGHLPAATAVPITNVPVTGVPTTGVPTTHVTPDGPTTTYLPMDVLGDHDDRTAEVGHSGTLARTGLPASPAAEGAATSPSAPVSNWIAAVAVLLLAVVTLLGVFPRSGDVRRASAPAAAPDVQAPLTESPHPAAPATPPPVAAHPPAEDEAAAKEPDPKALATTRPEPPPAAPKPTPPQEAPAAAADPTSARAAITEPPAASPPPAPKLGTLRILTDPPTARVWVDGVEAGASPRKLEGVDPGHHQVRVALGDDVGSFLVDVDAGADARWCYVFATRTAVAGACPR